MTGFDSETLRNRAAEYGDREAFAVVENERLETMPEAFRNGTYLWKDCEWIVRWYSRRSLDGHLNPAEETFRQNRMERVEVAIELAVEAKRTIDKLDALLTLEGIDVPIASAFLQFMDPKAYAAISNPCWRALVDADILSGAYPEIVGLKDYDRFLGACRELAGDAEMPVFAVGRALWRIGLSSEDVRR